MPQKTKFKKTKFREMRRPPIPLLLGALVFLLMLLTGCGVPAEPSPVVEPTPAPSIEEQWQEWSIENKPNPPRVLDLIGLSDQIGGLLNLELVVNTEAQEVWHEICLSANGGAFECTERTLGSSISNSINLQDGGYVVEVRVTAVNYPPSTMPYANLGGIESHGIWSHQFSVDSSPVTLQDKPIVFSLIDEVQIGGFAIDSGGSGISLVNVAEASHISVVPDAAGFFALYIPRSEIGNANNLTLQLFDNAMNATRISVYVPPPANSWVGRSADSENNEILYVFPADSWHPHRISDAGINFVIGWGKTYWQYYNAEGQAVGKTLFEPTWWIVLRWSVVGILAIVFLFVPDLLIKRKLLKIFQPSLEKASAAIAGYADVVNAAAEQKRQGLVSTSELQQAYALLEAQNASKDEALETMEAAMTVLRKYNPSGANVLLKLLTDERGIALVEKQRELNRSTAIERRHHG